MSPPTTPGLIAARRLALSGLVAVALLVPTPAPGAPEGQLTWAVHVSVAPTWFDPAETPGIIRSEEHTSELQSQSNLVCRLLLEKKKKTTRRRMWLMSRHGYDV